MYSRKCVVCDKAFETTFAHKKCCSSRCSITNRRNKEKSRCVRRAAHQIRWTKEKGKIPEGYEIHHIDHDHKNNNIENLVCVDAQTHMKLHKSLDKIISKLIKANIISFDKDNLTYQISKKD